jgi:hypothetical protein
MLTTAIKRFILPFSNQKSREPEVEAAAVYAFADLYRSRGGGLLNKQPQETIAFIAKVGYPFWLFPKNNSVLIFDGLNDAAYNVPYGESPSAATLMENLQTNQRPLENYLAFLSDHRSYFLQPPKERQFTFRGLIADSTFKGEFGVYRKEASEITAAQPLLSPILEESTISSELNEMDKLQVYFREDQAKLAEILRLINRVTSQYVSELNYEAEAAKEEADAKIKAQQEFISPQIAKLNKEYRAKIKELADGFDKELESLQKLKSKTEKFISKAQADIRQYEGEAKKQGKKGHEIYERRWKEKIKLTQKELSGLKKELNNIEDNIKRLSKQKGHDISQLNFELDSEIKLARQPIVELENARDAKMFAFKQESNRLLSMEKPVVDGINISLSQRETFAAQFDGLGISDAQFRSASLVYVSVYVICYKADLSRRYLCISPSTVSDIDFSARFKGALGRSKIRDLFTPRFKTIAAIIGRVEVLARQNSLFESQLWSLGDKNNLLKNSAFKTNISSGLSFLKVEGWLSEREAAELSGKLTA